MKVYTDLVHPAIGILIREGAPVYYAYIDGRRHERRGPCAMLNWIRKCERRGSRIGA